MEGPLRERKFLTGNDLERGIGNSVYSIPKDWYTSALRKLPDRWQRCTDAGGEYVKSATV
jgi:hypothetical protein